MERFIENLVSVAIAIGMVYLWAWMFSMDPNVVVGWMALGLAATARS